MKEHAERNIKYLEEQEMLLVNNIQQTFQVKQDAIINLSKKSKSLMKTLEPRGAYQYKPKNLNNSSSSRIEMNPVRSFSNGHMSKSHFNTRSKSVVPQSAQQNQ